MNTYSSGQPAMLGDLVTTDLGDTGWVVRLASESDAWLQIRVDGDYDLLSCRAENAELIQRG